MLRSYDEPKLAPTNNWILQVLNLNIPFIYNEIMNESNFPLISVIVPVYNVEKYLNRCIESIVAQTYKNIEIILVDDGSPDRCPSMCDDWAVKDSRTKAFHKENGGLSDARNYGFEKAHGEYISYIDSDDSISSDYFLYLFEMISQNDADVACVSHLQIQNDEFFPKVDVSKSHVIVLDNREACRELFTTEKVSTMAWGKLYKRQLIESIGGGGWPVGRVYEDTPTVCKFLYSAKKVVCSDVPLYFHFKTNESSITSTRSFKNSDDAIWSAMERARFFSSVNEKELSFFAWNFAGGNLIKILLKYPQYHKQWKHYVKEFKIQSEMSLYFKLKVTLAYLCPGFYKKLM